MKILIATDGSQCSADARKDLLRAGLPNEAEAIVFSVADVWLPPPGEADTGLPEGWNDAARNARARAEDALRVARQHADSGASDLQKLFNSWKIQSEAVADSPGWGIISRAEKWNADLVVVGSHGLSGLGKLMQGSVSQKVVTHAHCPVRIARFTLSERKQIRLIIGMDGSPGAINAVDQVVKRSWPSDTEIRIVAVLDPRLSTAAISYLPRATDWIQEGYQDEEVWIRNVVEKEAQKLQKTGLKVTTTIMQGDPKLLLIQSASDWAADCIFVGARGLTRIERFLMGSVSGAVASRAHCSVEVIRQ
ncbi:MAG TPA: universal stress protein [Acidobacteriota bacterium]|nr:universal stress protein [Acidobacteriota bacterium]